MAALTTVVSVNLTNVEHRQLPDLGNPSGHESVELLHGLKKRRTSKYAHGISVTWVNHEADIGEEDDLALPAKVVTGGAASASTDEPTQAILDNVWPAGRTEETAEGWDDADGDEEELGLDEDEDLEETEEMDGCGDEGFDWEEAIRAALVDESLKHGTLAL